jgi:hypothetical protein
MADDKMKSQRQKFIDAARELGADEDEKTFTDKLRRIVKTPPPADGSKKEKPGE